MPPAPVGGILMQIFRRRKVRKIEKIKCEKCGHTLLFVEVVKGEIKCPRCKKINKIEYSAKARANSPHH